MAIIQWDDSLSVGIEAIDAQHMKLVNMINELHTAMKQGKGTGVLSGLVSGLKDYAAVHFTTEEQLMDRHGYPEARGHKKEHARFIAQVGEFDENCQAGTCVLTMEVMNFLRDWLVDHIKGTDRKYAPFFKEKGVE
jgi:hemerythrin-like metal-binding protein